MPVKGCQSGGKSGKCYVGKGRTIKGNQENEQFN